MIYGTGGFAYGGGSAHLNVFDNVDNFFFSSGNNSSTRTGWTAGGGVEWAWTNNWTFGAEYLYYDLGSRHLVTVPNVAASNFFGATAFTRHQGQLRWLGRPRPRQLQVLIAGRDASNESEGRRSLTSRTFA